MSSNPQRRNEQSHAAILDATIEQLNAVGYGRLTIEKVATRAGVGKATVYRWWSSKAQLVTEALTQRCNPEPIAATGDLRSEVRALVVLAIDFVTSSPMGHTLLQLASETSEPGDGPSPVAECLAPIRAAHLALLYGAASRGELPHDVDANLLLDLILGTVLYRTLLGQAPQTDLVDQLTALFVDQELPKVTAGRRQFI